MDKPMTVRNILESYDEITINRELQENIFLISLFKKQFLFYAPPEDKLDSNPMVYLYNDSGLDCPHIMLRDKIINETEVLPDGKYRWVCLYEQESIVNSIISYDEKIIDTVERLIKLLSMNEVERNYEFQKEFIYYWNSSSMEKKEFAIYLKNEQVFSEMNVYYGYTNARIVDPTIHLSDINSREKKGKRKWERHLENDVFFIPIIDIRGILPPHRSYSWTMQDIRNIVYSPQIEHISSDTFQKLKCIIPTTQDVILVFGMQLDLNNIVFSARIKCNNNKGNTLLEKLLKDVVKVEPLYTTRKDYSYLNKQIGNDIGLLQKKVVLVGAGSLGSYVALELVKNGVSDIKIFDGDNLEDVNVLRWAYGGVGIGDNKAKLLSYLLNLLHPEVKAEAVNKNIEEDDLEEEVLSADLIVFTIGSSDEQLRFNRFLKKLNCSVPVIFVWLEAGGINSHLLVVNYQEVGCFECLYTDENGSAVNNRSRKTLDILQDKVIIRNGCGGTRAAYGTTILLRTTAALLDTINNIMSNKINRSVLIDISPDTLSISDTKFPEEECACCGHIGKK